MFFHKLYYGAIYDIPSYKWSFWIHIISVHGRGWKQTVTGGLQSNLYNLAVSLVGNIKAKWDHSMENGKCVCGVLK